MTLGGRIRVRVVERRGMGGGGIWRKRAAVTFTSIDDDDSVVVPSAPMG